MFPTTPLLDDYNRADGGLGTDYTSPAWSTDPAPTILSNVVIAGSGAFASTAWNRATFLQTEAWMTLPGASFSQAVLLSRASSLGATLTSYWVEFNAVGGINLSRVVAGASSGTIYSVALNLVGDNKPGIRTVTKGPDILNEIWADTGAGWVKRGDFLDLNRVSLTPALAAAGFIGYRQFGNGTTTRSIDDFGGGEMNDATPILPVDPPDRFGPFA